MTITQNGQGQASPAETPLGLRAQLQASPQMHDWLRLHGADPKTVYRATITIDWQHGADAAVRLFRYRLDADGHMFKDEFGEIATDTTILTGLLAFPELPS